MPLLIEAERRRPDFVEGEAIRLGDGQLWHVPRPRVRIRPVRDESGAMQLRGLFTFGDAYNAKFEAFAAARSGWEEKTALLDLAFDLLARNYDLTDDELTALLSWDADDPEAEVRLEALGAVVAGERPKPSPGGTGSASP